MLGLVEEQCQESFIHVTLRLEPRARASGFFASCSLPPGTFIFGFRRIQVTHRENRDTKCFKMLEVHIMDFILDAFSAIQRLNAQKSCSNHHPINPSLSTSQDYYRTLGLS